MIREPNKYYFAASEVIDWQHPEVFALAQQLANGLISSEQLARICQRWIMGNIVDCQVKPDSGVSCSASEVLILGQGSSFSRSHLLAALLRANGLASSFCYQRKQFASGEFGLYGYCAVWLSGCGWYPLEVELPTQQPICYHSGEQHYRIYSYAPLGEVVRVLQRADSWGAARNMLPDTISMG